MKLPAYEASYGHEHVAFAAAMHGEPLISPLSDARTAARIVDIATMLAADPGHGRGLDPDPFR